MTLPSDTVPGDSNDLLYSSYFGGSQQEAGYGIALVGADRVALSGYTYSPDLPVTADALQAGSRGNLEAFVARLDLSQPGAAGLTYGTYLGGSAADAGYALAVDGTGDVYLTGSTQSVDFLDSTAYPPSRTTTYGYDALDRLTAVNGQERTRYDAAGRLTAKEGASWRYAGEVQFAFGGPAHAPASRSDEQGNQEAYSYDANGNLALTDLTTYDGALMSTRFAWDAENRLARLETGNSSTGAWSTLFEVTYDGDGRRVRRHSPGATYSYPAYNTVYVEPHYEVETVSGEVTKYYFFGGQRVALRRNGVLYYLANDQLGSASVSYRADGGNVVGQRYEPWGEVNLWNQADILDPVFPCESSGLRLAVEHPHDVILAPDGLSAQVDLNQPPLDFPRPRWGDVQQANPACVHLPTLLTAGRASLAVCQADLADDVAGHRFTPE